jgi:hypothetical protein
MTWIILAKFADGSTVRERGIVGGIETRIFNADGTLRPLPGGRMSPADHDARIPDSGK